MSHFNPGVRSQVRTPYNNNMAYMEGAKANFSTALMTNEVCMKKCNMTDASDKLSSQEGDCIRQCFVKYFDSCLLIENEHVNYVRGINM